MDHHPQTAARRAASLLGAVVVAAGAAQGSTASASSADRYGHDAAAHSLSAEACSALAGYHYRNTTITSATMQAAGTLSFRGTDVAAHCLVQGTMNDRTSPVDGQHYAIGFEMRLPAQWNGRFAYQANGGLDGVVATALGKAGGSDSALQEGMAVISSDAGHTAAQNPTFGLDPQARLDYGYNAVGTLTPMAKDLVRQAYGSAPRHSYIIGSSNGGRHAMVAASRFPTYFDGVLAVDPGFNLPKAALAQIWGAQQWATTATTDDLASAFTPAERTLVASRINAVCDGLDGLADGLVQDSAGCQRRFSVQRDVPTCTTQGQADCMAADRKAVLARVFAGARTSDGRSIYASFPWDPGITQSDWAAWKFTSPIQRDSVALGYVFATQPYAPALGSLRQFVLGLDVDDAQRRINATGGIYDQSAMDFMTPTDLDYRRFIAAGGKMIVIHGGADGVFSMADTTHWYEQLDASRHGHAADNVRYFQVPGMGHTMHGPATDQNNAVAALVDWVEQDQAPSYLKAWVDPTNTELPAGWSLTRSRPLCAYPAVATYVGGDTESASSFVCRRPGRSHR